MPLFQRTIKLTLATCLAAALAYALGLTYAISAGVIAILSISDMKSRSYLVFTITPEKYEYELVEY